MSTLRIIIEQAHYSIGLHFDDSDDSDSESDYDSDHAKQSHFAQKYTEAIGR